MYKPKIITIDGPSGSGKGTVAQHVAEILGWDILDSGILYRLVALEVHNQGVDLEDEQAVVKIASSLDVSFRKNRIIHGNQDVTDSIRSEIVGNTASKVASITAIREVLLQWQRDSDSGEGLVADGRDMGTVVFPDAPVKIYLTASAQERAKRRYKQLIEKGISANLASLVDEIRERDLRDSQRETSPLRAADDSILIDSSTMHIEEVVEAVLEKVYQTFGYPA